MRKFLIALLAGLFLASCEMISQKNVELPPAVESLVVIGLANNLGVGVYVSQTMPLQSPVAGVNLIDALVQLVDSKTPVANLQRNSQLDQLDTALYYDGGFSIRVVHPTLGEATAPLEALPSRMGIRAATLRGGPQDSEGAVSFTFSDQPGSDYYAYQIIPLKDGAPLTALSPYSFRQGSLMDDTNFDGKTQTVTDRLTMMTTLADGTRLFANGALIYLHHLSANTYRYYRSLQEYEAYSEDTFADPSPVITNVRNGYGYVGVSYVDSLSIRLER